MTRLSQLRQDNHRDLENLDKTLQSRLTEGREDRNQLWTEIRGIQHSTAEQHRIMLERLGNIPTRTESREDLARIEDKIEQMRKDLAK